MRKKKNPFLRVVFFLFVIIFAAMLFAYWYYQSLLSAVGSDPTPKVLVIQKGESVSEIADKLEQQNLIKSSFAFKTYLKLSSQDLSLQAGDFKISENMSVPEIITTLSKGPIDVWVTFPEGWRIEEMARRLNSEMGINNEEFIKEAEEGYMFPDTYLFNKDATAGTIATTMKNTFEKRYDETLQKKIRANGLTPEEGVILASIVEREARSDEVRTKVAGILLKRLNIGMALQADATVRYAKDSQELARRRVPKQFWAAITQVDYRSVVSDYNTYLNPGLPPAPICNPSLSSLKAVANADSSTPYLYYYHDSKGNSYYARTLEEHNRNVANHR